MKLIDLLRKKEGVKKRSNKMPFAGYKNFQDCVNKNKNKKNPQAYCSSIMRQVEKKKTKKKR